MSDHITDVGKMIPTSGTGEKMYQLTKIDVINVWYDGWDYGRVEDRETDAVDALNEFLEAHEHNEETCEDISTINFEFKCSNCGCEVDETGVDNGLVNFCPDCGKRVDR